MIRKLILKVLGLDEQAEAKRLRELLAITDRELRRLFIARSKLRQENGRLEHDVARLRREKKRLLQLAYDVDTCERCDAVVDTQSDIEFPRRPHCKPYGLATDDGLLCERCSPGYGISGEFDVTEEVEIECEVVREIPSTRMADADAAMAGALMTLGEMPSLELQKMENPKVLGVSFSQILSDGDSVSAEVLLQSPAVELGIGEAAVEGARG